MLEQIITIECMKNKILGLYSGVCPLTPVISSKFFMQELQSDSVNVIRRLETGLAQVGHPCNGNMCHKCATMSSIIPMQGMMLLWILHIWSLCCYYIVCLDLCGKSTGKKGCLYLGISSNVLF